MRILVATNRSSALGDFIQALQKDADVALAETGAEALDKMRQTPPALAVVDTGLSDMGPFGLVTEMMMVNAMVNSAVISPLSHQDYEEQSEGLGVLVQLPETPAASDAADLLDKLKGLGM